MINVLPLRWLEAQCDVCLRTGYNSPHEAMWIEISGRQMPIPMCFQCINIDSMQAIHSILQPAQYPHTTRLHLMHVPFGLGISVYTDVAHVG